MIRHTVSLPEPMSDYVKNRLEEGQYGDISEYFRDLVRKDQERHQLAVEAIRIMIDEAEASGMSDLNMHQIKEKVRKDSEL